MAIGEGSKLVAGRYRVDRELDRGADTQSLLVTDVRSGRPCVLRQLNLAAASPEAARRFKAQAGIIAKIDHPGLPRFIDAFTEGEGADARSVVVTSYHPGESLERLVAKGRPLTESQALVLLRRIVPVLVYLHGFEPPLVHRTISATGIILGPDGRPCLTDLDYTDAERSTPTVEQVTPDPDELVLAAPEVFAGGAVPASDIYAIGLAVCRAMTARDPAVLLREGAKMQLRGALGASDAFTAVIVRMLEPSLDRRYPDAKTLDADLGRLAGVRVVPLPVTAPQKAAGATAEAPRVPRGSRPVIYAVVGAVIFLGLALLAVRARNPSPEGSLLVPPAVQEPAAVTSSPATPEPNSSPAPVPAVAPPAGDPAAPAPLTPVPDGQAAPQVPAPGSSLPVSSEPSPPPSQAASGAAAVPAPAAAEKPPGAPAAAAGSFADAAGVVAEGRLLFDGKPFTNGAPPSFWFRKEGSKSEVKPQVEYAAGGFTIRGLSPGRYAMSVRIDQVPGNPKTYPGDLTAWEEFTLEAGRPASLEVSLRTVMHLVQPVDNGALIPGWDVPCGAGNVHPGKVVFSWEGLGPGTRYDVSVVRIDCGAGAAAGNVFTQSSTETWVRLDLPPNREGESYAFRLTANRGGRTIGIMNTHGKSGIGWDYRFSVTK